ncbi:zinc ribbon domain-containing protein [Lachnospiraceae bacterium 45-P1]
MALLDEVKKSLASTGKQVAKRTREITDTMQLKARIGAENEKIEKFCAEIGRKVFENAKEQDEERFAAEFEFIRGCLAKRDELEQHLADLDGSMFCSACGAKIDRNAKFCSHCGAPTEKQEEASKEEVPALAETAGDKAASKEEGAPAVIGESAE